MRRVLLAVLIVWLSFLALSLVWIAQADVQCRLGRVPWPLDGC